MPDFHPIIYVRGYAMTDDAREDTVNTPYMGFNLGSTRIRLNPDGSCARYIFESPLIRLMKKRYGYRDIYENGAIHDGPLPRKSIAIHRYCEDEAGASIQPTIPEAAEGLNALVKKLRDQICGEDAAARAAFKVYLVAHSMGGVVCRCFLQNDHVGQPESKACVDKVFTYGTPHNGVDIRTGWNVNLPGFADVWDFRNFNREKIAEYMQLTPIDGNVNHLDGKFPPARFFSFIGTNHSDYGAMRHVVGTASDGLVKIQNAYVAKAPRAHAYVSHSGHYGMVNSEEGFSNLVRFLFGDLFARSVLVPEALPLPPSLRKEHENGASVTGSYLFSAKVTPRNLPPVPLSERTIEQGTAVFRTYDELFYPDRVGLDKPRYPTLYSVCLDTSEISSGQTVVYTIDLLVRSTDFRIEGRGWFRDKRIPDENLFRENLVIRATRKAEGWTLRYVLGDKNWGENIGKELSWDEDREVFYIPLSNPKGFKAKLLLEFKPWK